MTDVSVVLPTVGRRSLRAATESALGQADVDVEVIVVDALGDLTRPAWSNRSGLRWLSDNRRLGPGEARQAGTEAAQGKWVAYLDDDDVFANHKCRSQIEIAAASQTSLVTSGFTLVPYPSLAHASTDGDAPSPQTEETDIFARLAGEGIAGPMQSPAPGEALVHYLFHRATIRNRSRLVTSSILIDRGTAMRTPWNRSLRRFEDWEWLVRIDRAGVGWTHLHDPLVAISIGGPNSLTEADTDREVEQYLTWAIALLADSAPRELGDLLMCDVAVTLANRGDLRGALRAAGIGMGVARPGLPAMLRFCAAVGQWGYASITTNRPGR